MSGILTLICPNNKYMNPSPEVLGGINRKKSVYTPLRSK